MLQAFDHSLFFTLNASPDTPLWAITLGVVAAKYVIYLIPAMLTGLWLWGDSHSRQTALHVLLVTAITLLCNSLIGQIWPTPRPFVAGIGHHFLAHAPTPSFPSNHLGIFVSTGLVLMLHGTRRLGTLTLGLGVIVAWARIFTGVHFPLDMAGAAVVSLSAYAVTRPVWSRTGPRVTAALEHVYRCVFAKPIAAGWVRR